MDFWKSPANLNPFRKMRAGALPKYALFYLKLSFRSWLRFTNTKGTDLIYKTALSLSLLLCFSVSTAFGACIAVSGSSCYRPGGTNPLYFDDVGLVYYRNATCSQSCTCHDAQAVCAGCPYQVSGACYSNTTCATACTPVPEFPIRWLIYFGFVATCYFIFRNRTYRRMR
jgi:hypothetical protein